MRHLLVLIALLTIGGCVSKQDASPPRVAATTRPTGLTAAGPDGKQYPVICRLQSYDKTITGISGPGGPMYSVHDGNGVAMVKHATLQEMRVQHPELHDMIRSSFAGVHADNVDGRPDRDFQVREPSINHAIIQPSGQPVDRFYDANRDLRE